MAVMLNRFVVIMFIIIITTIIIKVIIIMFNLRSRVIRSKPVAIIDRDKMVNMFIDYCNLIFICELFIIKAIIGSKTNRGYTDYNIIIINIKTHRKIN